ncbi:Putative exported protein [Salinisphaera shabanensis E1L3A]|jgi:phospholipid transport system substrate-binding protein|uniref:Exported protein n=2 Tax=Salinisphaera shabanensis TaxID=180542 RepID=U2EHY3_9GAMM|nr:Putative exported protein [Salinisphaera shabanensis E1L3A]
MLRMKRSWITAVAVALLVPALALAAPTPPDQLARETVQSVLSKMEGRRDELRKNPQELYQLIDRELVPLVDLPYMSQLVLGRAWRTATPEQRDRFQTAFKNMLIRTYGNGLLSFDDSQEIEYQPVRAAEGADDVTFRAIVTTDDGQKTPVTFQLHIVDGEWKIYDGSVGNLSFVTNYRGQFNSQIRSGGLEQLIERMESRYNTGS